MDHECPGANSNASWGHRPRTLLDRRRRPEHHREQLLRRHLGRNEELERKLVHLRPKRLLRFGLDQLNLDILLHPAVVGQHARDVDWAVPRVSCLLHQLAIHVPTT